MEERTYPPQRRRRRRPNYTPLIVFLTAVLVIVASIAIGLSISGCTPEEKPTEPVTRPSTEATTPSSVQLICNVRNVSIVLLVVFAALWVVQNNKFTKTEAYSTYKTFKANLKAKK